MEIHKKNVPDRHNAEGLKAATSNTVSERERIEYGMDALELGNNLY